MIVHRYFWPENISELPLMFRSIVKQHLARGQKVTVVTGASQDYTREWSEEFQDQVQFVHFRAANDRNQRAWQRVVSATRLLFAALKTLFKRQYELLYVVSYPPLFAGVLLTIARLFRRANETIFYAQDLFTYRLPDPISRKIYQWFTGITVRRASRTITLSQSMKQQLAGYAGKSFPDRRIVVVPNPVSSDAEFLPQKKQVDIIYAGAHGKAQNLYHFLESLAATPEDKRPTAAFFGNGTEKSKLQQVAADLQLNEFVTFTDAVSREEVVVEMAKARYGLVGAVPELLHFAFPSKLANYGYAGTPSLMMCDSEGETARWLQSSGLGRALDPVSVDRAAEQLAEVKDGASDLTSLEMHQLTRTEFGMDIYLNRLNELLDSIENAQQQD